MADFDLLGDGLRKVLLAGIGALAIGYEKSSELVDELVKKGEITVEQGKALNTELIGLSVDSLYAHIAWLRKIQDLEWNGMKGVEVKFPLIEDIKMEVANKFGMIQPSSSTTQAVRAVFVIDPEAVIRTILYYPASTGRNFDEIKRIVVALQKADAEQVATPANWRPGQDVIIPTAGSCGVAKERMESQDEEKYCLDWFLCFRREKK